MPTDISMRMGAVGVKGEVLDGTGRSKVAMNVKFDAMWVGTKSEDTDELAATEGDVTRLRLILEGNRAFELGNGATFTPSAELGLRHDGGDAETGTGVEAGAGLRYSAEALTVEGRVRALVAHEATGYREWGASGAIRVTPSACAAARGLSGGEFRLLAAELALGAGDSHPLAGAHADQVTLEFGEGGEDVEEHLPHGIVRVVSGWTQGQLDLARQELIGDLTGAGNRSGQLVELGHDERVAGAHGCKGLVEVGAGARPAGEAVIGVDALGVDAEVDQGAALRREVLSIGEAASVTDADGVHGTTVR